MSSRLKERYGVDLCKWLARAGEYESGNYRGAGYLSSGIKAAAVAGIISNELAVIQAEMLERQQK